MSDGQVKLEQYDEWLTDDSDVAALVMRQWLEPVEGEDAIIFPPTYAKPERVREEDWLGYNIDQFSDGTNVCQIDSVGSQGNRMEPIFKREPYSKLVPCIVIKAGEREVDLLDVGHRAADASIRFSDLAGDLERAFNSIKSGDAEPLAKIAPTSLVFGAWDSRATQVKVPRIVRSVIRAYGVKVLHRSAQYVPAIEYVNEGLLEGPSNKTQQDSMSALGLSHAPAPWTHGGVQVSGEIRRDGSLNLAALRALGTKMEGMDWKVRTLVLRRYILGLSLVSFTAPIETFLREGCQLVPDTGRPTEWYIVRHDGRREPLSLSPGDALTYVQEAADGFGVGPARKANFNSTAARAALGQSRDERRRSRRGGSNQAEGEQEE